MDFSKWVGIHPDAAKKFQGREPLILNVKTAAKIMELALNKLEDSPEVLEQFKVLPTPDGVYVYAFQDACIVACLDLITGKMVYLGQINYDLSTFSRGSIDGQLVENPLLKIEH